MTPAERAQKNIIGFDKAVQAKPARRLNGHDPRPPPPDFEDEEVDPPPLSFDAHDLMEMNMADPSYVCRPWISEGVTALVGRPKLGKTTLLRQLVHAANTGGPFLSSPCDRAEVLFLSLEEGPRLMRKKLLNMGVKSSDLAGVEIAFEWKQAADGVAKLREWLQARKHDNRLPLILIDALVRFRLPPSDRGNAYQEDYNAIRLLSELCKEFQGLCIVVLHHVRKSVAAAEDPVSLISGTYGLTASIDSYLIVMKEGSRYRLHAGGRLWMGDNADFELKREGGGWMLAGNWDALAAELPPKQRAVMDELRKGAKTNNTLCELTGQEKSAMSHLLRGMADRGLIEKIANGWGIVK